MVIKNADVYTEEGKFVNEDIYIDGAFFADGAQMAGGMAESLKSDMGGRGGRVIPASSLGSVEAGMEDGLEIDAAGCYAIPALTDIHFHGCAGYDFCDGTKEAVAAMAAYEAAAGIANIVPATMTLSEAELVNICQAAKKYSDEDVHENRAALCGKLDADCGKDGRLGKSGGVCSGENGGLCRKAARLCGINMEGPFISVEKKGAQNEEYIRKPDILLFDRLNAVSGNMIKLVSIAPEVEGAMEFIERKSSEAVISIAHTAADYDTSILAFKKGASHVTHLYNAMNPYTHRAPGPIGAVADAVNAKVELICDGIHIHPAAVRTTFKIFGDERIIFISDSMRATGLADGSYTLGGQDVAVSGNLATLKDGTIAGSVTNLMDCLRTAVLGMGIPLESAVKCASVNPSKCIGIYDKHGSITAGKTADLVLLKKETLETVQVILEGRILR